MNYDVHCTCTHTPRTIIIVVNTCILYIISRIRAPRYRIDYIRICHTKSYYDHGGVLRFALIIIDV